VLKLVQGEKLTNPTEPQPEGAPACPYWVRTKTAKRVWTEYVDKAWWLTWADEAKAGLFCNLLADYIRAPRSFTATMFGQLRCLGSELGLDPMARSRIKDGSGNNGKAPGLSKYT
jgi:phage terminase small subunit